jgi:hypothetical protein
MRLKMNYTTLENIRAEIRANRGFSSNTIPDSSTVLRWISEAESQIDFKAQRTYKPTTKIDLIDYDGSQKIILKHSPIIDIITFEYNTSNLGETENWETKIAGEDFLLYADSGEILIILKKFKPKIGNQNIRITYQSGFTDIPTTVKLLATKMVALRVLDTLLMQSTGDGKTEPERIRIGAVQIIEPASISVSSYSQTKEDIIELKRELVGGFGVYRYGT